MAGSSTAIGSAAIVLSANADRLTAGLDKAKADVGKWAGNVSKTADRAAKSIGGEGKGGFLGRVLGAGAFGGVAGLAMAGVHKAIEFIRNLPDLTQRLGEKATGSDLGALQSVAQGFTRIQEGVDTLLTKGLALIAPAFGAIIDAGSAFGEKLAPWIEKVGEAFSAWLYYQAKLFGEFLSGTADVIESIGQWATETLGLATTTQGAGDQMFAVLRMVGKGFAYVWDTIKAGAGVVSVVVGYIAEGFGTVVQVIGKAIEQLAKLANELPESIRPDWIGKAADAVKGWGDSIDAAGQKMQAWGLKAVMAWGDSAAAADKWFDGVQQRYNQRKEAFNNPVPIQPKLAGALLAGSKEAYSVVAKFQAGAAAAGQDGWKRLEKRQEETIDVLKQIRENIEKNGGRFEVI